MSSKVCINLLSKMNIPSASVKKKSQEKEILPITATGACENTHRRTHTLTHAHKYVLHMVNNRKSYVEHAEKLEVMRKIALS